LHSRTIRIEFAIVQQQSQRQGHSDSDHHLAIVPARRVRGAPQPPMESASSLVRPEMPVMPQQGNPGEVPTDFDHLILFPTRYATYVPAGLPAQSASGPAFGVLPTADGGKVVWAVR